MISEEKSSSSAKVEQNQDLYDEIIMAIRNVLTYWWVVAVVALVFAALGYLYAQYQYNKIGPQYTSRSSFAISTRDYENMANPNTVYQSASDFMATDYIANTYSYIITSRDVLAKVREKTGYKNTGKISTALIENTNIMVMSVTTSDAEMSQNISKAIIDVIDDKDSVVRSALVAANINVIEQPSLPTARDTNAHGRRYTVYGFLFGFILAAGILFLLHYFKSTVKSASSLQAQTNMNLLGSIPHVLKPGTKIEAKKTPVLVTDKRFGFAFVETYKSIRTRLENSARKNGYKTFMFTSSLENEGKTTVAVNVAITLAQNNRKVLFIDADLRKPAIHLICGISMDDEENKKRRILDVLDGRITLEKAVFHNEKTGLDVLISGTPKRNSSELLSTDAFTKLLDQAKLMYDFIIVDTPPAKLVTDAMVIAAMTDAAVLVVRQDVAGMKEVVSVSSELSQSSADLIGFVFNNVEDSTIIPSKYYYGRHYGYYGKRYGYYGKKSSYYGKSGYYGRSGYYGGYYGRDSYYGNAPDDDVDSVDDDAATAKKSNKKSDKQ